jgi:UDP-N-acetylmuramoyl-tripeptide--D-alanyl-D-alanine ligase
VHTSEFGSIEEVARAKGELVEALPRRGIAILNAADHRVAAMARRTDATVLTFGDGGDVRAEDLTLDDDLRPTFVLASPWERAKVTLMVRGRHQVENALAAAAAGLAEGIGEAAVVRGLERGSLSRWRMELATAPSGALVLNDAYNANPTSVAAALESLAAVSARRRIAVLGVMAELGDRSEADHAAIGALARDLGIEVIAVDAPAYGARDVATIDDALAALAGLGDGDAVLVKGSRVAGLERLADALLDPA